MGRFSNHHQHWNEFQWEEEIRRDEQRISGYFRELAGCLDLPDEEELIYGQLAAKNELVPQPESTESLRDYFSGSDEDEEEYAEHLQPRRTVESATVDELDMLCAEWNIFISSPLPPPVAARALGCSCAFAKLLARSADFLEPETDCSPALLKSIGKRALKDLNETVELLSEMAASYKVFQEKTGMLISRLGEIRERLLARLDNCR